MTVDTFTDEMEMASRLDGVPWVRPTMIGINGAGSQGNDWGFASDVCNQVDHEIWETIIIDYSASAFPMGDSVLEGIEKVVAAVLAAAPGKKALVGYSEGSLVINHVWRDECLSDTGRLHQMYLAGDIIVVILFGDPMRCPGKANGNIVAGFPVPGEVNGVMSGGIANVDDLTPEQTPDYVLSCTNTGDMYGCSPTGDNPWTLPTGVAHDMQIVFDIVQKFNAQNIFAILTEVMQVLGISTGGISMYSIIGLLEGSVQGLMSGLANIPITGATEPAHAAYLVAAVLNGGMFVLSGFGPHGDYAKMVPAIVNRANEIGAPFASV